MTSFLFWLYDNALWIGVLIIAGLIGFWLYSSITEVSENFSKLLPDS